MHGRNPPKNVKCGKSRNRPRAWVPLLKGSMPPGLQCRSTELQSATDKLAKAGGRGRSVPVEHPKGP